MKYFIKPKQLTKTCERLQMKATAIIRLKLPSQRQRKAVNASLLPEINKPGFSRAQATIAAEGSFLVVKITADDTIALRSALNAYLRWINSIKNTIETLG